MEKILVTTDFSANSKAGMRFAIQMAQAAGAELTFLHVHYVLRATIWTDREYEQYARRSRETLLQDLTAFVKGVYRAMKIKPVNYQLAIHQHLDTVEGIMEYATQHGAAYICLSTRGAGTLRKIFGTNTGKLIARSAIPVLCIPGAYRVKPISQVLYVSDMAGYEAELMKVVAFARPLNATIQMLHLSYPYEFMLDQALMEQTLYQKTGYKISFRYQARGTASSLLEDIRTAVDQSKPSVLVMFTHQHRDFIDRILLPGNAKEYTFHPKIPLLSFNKSGAVSHQADRPAAAAVSRPETSRMNT